MRSDPRAVLSISYLVILTLVAALAPWIAPYSPLEQDVSKLLLEPSWTNWLA